MMSAQADHRSPNAVWLYLALAFGISWVTFVIRVSIDWPYSVDQALRLIIKFGPSLAGLAAAFSVAGYTGLHDILRRLNPLGARLSWSLFALLVPVVVSGAALLARRALGGEL